MYIGRVRGKTIVVLGCMLHNCEPTEEMKGRVEKALKLADLIGPDNIILSGGLTSPECGQSEAGAMQTLMLERPGLKARVILEQKSQNTVENAVFSREAMESYGIGGELYIVTSCYHMSRSLFIFRKVIQGVETMSGFCYECKPERLESEVNHLSRDRAVIDRIEWNSVHWLDDYLSLVKR